MFNVFIDYLAEDDEVAVVRQTTTKEPEPLAPVFSGDDLLCFQGIVRKVPIAEDVVRYAVRLAAASRPGAGNSLAFVNEWVTWGAGLRASQYMVLGGKARALLLGRSHVSFEDIQALAHPVLRHRVLINYRAEAEGVTVDQLVDRLLKSL
jgi:MoxR-like ATPase